MLSSIFLLLTASCSGRNYEAFYDIPSNKVKKICEACAERKYEDKTKGKYLYLKTFLGIYDSQTYVNIVEVDQDFALGITVIEDIYVDSCYVCTVADGNFVDVWVENKGSFTIESAYNLGYLSKENLKSIRNLYEEQSNNAAIDNS